MAKLGNPAGLNTILNLLLPSYIISAPPPPPPNINVEVVAPSQTNTSRTTLKLGKGEVLKCHPFYSRIHSMMFLPNYFVRRCRCTIKICMGWGRGGVLTSSRPPPPMSNQKCRFFRPEQLQDPYIIDLRCFEVKWLKYEIFKT